MRSSRFHSRNTKGPEPTGLRAKSYLYLPSSSVPSLAQAVGETIAAENSAREARKGA